MAEIVPTILVATPGDYHERLEEVKPFAKRVHVDITDGEFAQAETINLAQVYVPEGYELDLHLMVKDPFSYLESALALKPALVIVHAEADGDHLKCIKEIQSFGVDAGIALLPESPVEKYAEYIKLADHALIFTGTLGHSGGIFDAKQLHKISEAKSLNDDIETSVDGGVNHENISLIEADVAYSGAGYMELVNE